MTDEAESLPIDARVIAFDRKADFNIDEKHLPYIKAIWQAYVYDRNSHFHLCEFTPSYEMWHLYFTVEFTDEGEQLSEADQDEIYQAYEYEDTQPVDYMHVGDVTAQVVRIKERNLPHCYYVHGDPELDEARQDYPDRHAWYEKVMEALVEHFNANHVI